MIVSANFMKVCWKE